MLNYDISISSEIMTVQIHITCYVFNMNKIIDHPFYITCYTNKDETLIH